VIAALLFVSSCDDGPKYNWYESYEPESDQPYGTMVINKLLTDYSKDGKLEKIDGPMHDRLQPSQADGSSAYVFIGRSLFLSEQGADTLLDFVKRGNKALISAKGLPEQLINELSDLGCTYETYGELTEGEDDSTAHLNFYHPQFKEVSGYDYSFFIQDRMMEYTWFYFKTGNICDTGNVVNYLGYMGNHKVNFIRIPYGKGEFLLHSTPLVFTNYYMVSKKGVEYADKVFSHLVNEATGEKPALTVYWDSYHNMPMYDGEEGTSKRETPLRFLLSQQTLKWALYLTLILLLVYIVFRSKRKQRVIPVLEEKENTSLEFVQTIGTLYFLQNEHRKLALQKMKLFLQYIRNRYSIPTNNMNEETLKKISIKSQVPQQQLSAIMEQYQWIEGQPEISDQSLISFHKSIDNFYKTCK
jgi:hypothetical protein